MLKIETRQWVAAWYRCPVCGAQSGNTMLSPYEWKHRSPGHCFGYKCNNAMKEVVERRWYTTFCIEPGVSFTTVAGTLEKIGPFKICDIVHPNIQTFRRWYHRRKAEEAEKTRQYLEHERQADERFKARMAAQAQETAAKQAVYQGDFDPFWDEDELP